MATAHRAPVVTVRWRRLRRSGAALAVVLGFSLAALPAQAAPGDPGTAAEAEELVAARGHELEALTEEFNENREHLRAAQAAMDAATAELSTVQGQLATAQESVRGIARSAYTGEGLGAFRAMMTSGSTDEFVGKLSMLQMVAGHQNGVLEQAAAANVAAAEARAAAEQATAEAQARYDEVAAQKAALEEDIAEYQAMFAALSAAEQRAAVEHGSHERASREDRAEPVAVAGPVVASSAAAQIAVDTAMAQRGKSYVWAAAGPDTFDCSGLVQYAYAAAGVGVPHSSRMQASMGRSVSRAELQPGDLVAFYSPISHIGIYIGNGQMVHAPTSGDVVKVTNIDNMGGITAMTRLVG